MYRVILFFLATFTLLLSSQETLSAQQQNQDEISVKAFFTKDSIMIGDQLFLRVIVDKDIMTATEFPNFEGGFGEVIEILGAGGVDTLSSEGRRVSLKRDYLVTSFDAGSYNIGKFPILRMDKNIVDTIFSQDSIYLHVNTFLIDSTKHKIVDITAPIDTPLTFNEIKDLVFIGLLGLLLLAGAIYAYIQWRKRKAEFVAQQKINTAPHIWAKEELEKIYSLKLWDEGKHKIYYSGLSDVLRQYLERRYNFTALEMTTDEIMQDIATTGISQKQTAELSEILSLSDLVKFAKLAPSPTDCQQSYEQAIEFIERTQAIELDVEQTKNSNKDEN